MCKFNNKKCAFYMNKKMKNINFWIQLKSQVKSSYSFNVQEIFKIIFINGSIEQKKRIIHKW